MPIQAPWAVRLRLNRVSYGTAYCLLLYVATRAAVAMGTVTAYLLKPKLSWHAIATHNDAWWYIYIAQHGYGAHLRLHLAHDALHSRYSTWAFYPGYPLVIRALHEISRMPYTWAAFVAATVIGAVAVRAVYALGEAIGGLVIGRGSALLIATWPGSAAMNLPYSEGLFIAAVAGSLAAVARRHWLLAGLLGLVATATRAMGLALLAALFVAAVLELRKHWDWRVVAMPFLATLGVGSFYALGWWQTGDPLVWRHAEDLWKQRLDFSASVFWHFGHDFAHRGGRAVTSLLLAGGMLMLAAMTLAALAMRRKVTPPLAVYAVIAGFLILGYGHVGPRPRMVLAVVPGFTWLAMWLRPRLTEILGVCLASTLALVSFLYIAAVLP